MTRIAVVSVVILGAIIAAMLASSPDAGPKEKAVWAVAMAIVFAVCLTVVGREP